MTETTSTRPALERANYFDGQLLTANLLNNNLANEWERRWTHNRVLHGSGIITGLTVDAEIGEATLTVAPGHAIDPLGREIISTPEVTLQVPPVAASPDNPRRFVLVARFNEAPQELTTEGVCDTSGVSGWLEEPVFEFLDESTQYPGQAQRVVALATVSIERCVIFDINFARRRVLGERPLPYVNAGVFTPEVSDWEMVMSAGGDPIRFGFSIDVDTTEGGFGSTPTYQARLSGLRHGTATVQGAEQGFLFFTPEVQVLSSTATSITVHVLIPTVQVQVFDPEGGFYHYYRFDDFLTLAGVGNTEAARIVTEDLEWAISWVGVEGQL